MKITPPNKYSDLINYSIIIAISLVFSLIIGWYSSLLNYYPSSPIIDLMLLIIMSLSFSASFAALGTSAYLSFNNKSETASVITLLGVSVISLSLQAMIQTLLLGEGYIEAGLFILLYLPFIIVPYGLLGYAFGILIRIIKNKKKINHKVMSKTILITFLIALSLTFISGFFGSSPMVESYNEKNHYYIHRGIPFIFSGTTAVDKSTPTHIVKIPLTTFNLGSDYNQFQRIIDLVPFLKAIAFYSLIVFIPSFLVSQKKFSRKEVIIYSSIYVVFLFFTLFIWKYQF